MFEDVMKLLHKCNAQCCGPENNIFKTPPKKGPIIGSNQISGCDQKGWVVIKTSGVFWGRIVSKMTVSMHDHLIVIAAVLKDSIFQDLSEIW